MLTVYQKIGHAEMERRKFCISTLLVKICLPHWKAGEAHSV